jgi:transposase-like protein
MKKVQPSERKRKLFEQSLQNDGKEMVEAWHQRCQETIIQETLEAEISDFLGRKWYEHKPGGQTVTGYRNGYYPRQIKTRGGLLALQIPRARNTREPFVSKVLHFLGHLTGKLENLAQELYIRGLSTRDIEEALLDTNGNPLLSRSAVSRLNDRLHQEHQAFRERDLSTLDVAYLFVDGVYEAVRRFINGRVLLCAWAITSDGKKHLVDVMAAQSESTDAWEVFFNDMLRRGLRQPLLVVSDGAGGIHAAIERAFPRADRQRCLVHKLRNIGAKLPKAIAGNILAEVKAVYYAPDRATADTLAAQFIEKRIREYPTAVQCFSDDLDACLTQLNYPMGHRKFIRTTNLLERAFVEEKRRTKVFPQHQDERSMLGLVFAVLYRASERWYRVSMTSLELVQLRSIRSLKAPVDHDNGFLSYRIAA